MERQEARERHAERARGRARHERVDAPGAPDGERGRARQLVMWLVAGMACASCRTSGVAEDAPESPSRSLDPAEGEADAPAEPSAAEVLAGLAAAAVDALGTSVPSADAIPVLTTQLAAAHRDDDVAVLSDACGQGDAEACLVAGARLQDGTGDGFLAMLDHWQLACAQGHPEACGWLVAALARADALRLAEQRLRGACDRGQLAACGALGWALRDTPDAARALLAPACDAGRGDACLYLATVHEGAGARRDAFVRACHASEPRGCLGAALDDLAAGDLDEAEVRLRAACRDGVGDACGLVGALLWRREHGAETETETDPARREERRTLLRAACEGGSALACHGLAVDPVDEDDPLDRLAAATPWYVTACNLGRGEACHAFALRLRAVDVEEGGREVLDELTRRACVDGVRAACDLLASEPAPQ